MDRGGNLQRLGTLVAKQLLDPADGIALVVEQPVDAVREIDVGGPVVAAVFRALHRPQRKLGLPIAQDVLGDAKLQRQFADRLESARRLVGAGHPAAYFATRSRMIWLARKVITRRGAIGTSTPVLGLRPTRCPLSRRMNVPNPEIFTFWPWASPAHMW